MKRKFSWSLLWSLLLTAILLSPSSTSPVYPLYAINTQLQENLTQDDLNTIATSFSYTQGGFTEEQLTEMKKINPNFGPVSYINAGALEATLVEPKSRFGAAFYLAGELLQDLDKESTSLRFLPAEGTSPLKASAIPGNYSKSGKDNYVTFVRVGEELMRLEKVSYASSWKHNAKFLERESICTCTSTVNMYEYSRDLEKPQS